MKQKIRPNPTINEAPAATPEKLNRESLIR